MDIIVILILVIFLIYIYETGKFLLDYKFIVIIVILALIVYDPSFLKDFMMLFYNTNKKNINIPNLYKTKTNKRSVSNGVKKMVASNQLWRCKSCNMLLNATYEVDHIVPLYKGGTNEIYNLQALCRNCHGNKTLMDKFLY